jgi:hypothetical protein
LLAAINFVFISLTEIFSGAFARLVKVFLTSYDMENVTEPEIPVK